MATVTAHGATLTVTAAGIRVERTPMGQTLLPAELTISPENLRGWYHHAPTRTSPGWIQFSVSSDAGHPEDTVARPLRGYPATHGVPNVVAFAPGQTEAFRATQTALTALQGGYPVPGDAATAAPDGLGVTAADAADGSSTVGAAASSADGSPQGLFDLPNPAADSTAPTATAPEKKAPGSARGQSTWRRVAAPDVLPEPDLTADADGPVFGQNVTVTGDFEPYEKGEVWDMIAAAGGTVGKNVTKKTTVLIIGEWGSVTSKEKRARELRDKGQDIVLWTFDEFLDKIGTQRRPTLSEVKGTDAPF